ncbi:MAG: hypothetical protein H0U76_29090 [Ktedonobacteraceae bacterium]|nr:hypothetical protein [Ktedonobacteraceae bacterium]
MDSPSSQISKEQVWNQTYERFSHVTDRLHMPIDSGILETVVAFNVLNMQTTGSCEGHLDHGTYAPYIHFNSNWLREDNNRASEKLSEARKQRELKQLSADEVEHLFEEGRQLRGEVRRKHIQSFLPLLRYLTAFYAERLVPYDRRLILMDGQGILSTLESQGAQFQVGTSPEHRQQKLVEYQQEMFVFGNFLKQRYFEEENHATS